MHRLFKIASAVMVILTVVVAALFAQTCENLHPSGSIGRLDVSRVEGHDPNSFAAIAGEHNITLAKVAWEPENGRTVRVISVLTTNRNNPRYVSGQSVQPGRVYPDYGWFSTTHVKEYDTSLGFALGLWIMYGTRDDAAALIKDLPAQGIDLGQLTSIVTVRSLADDFNQTKFWLILIVGILAVFLAALVSESTGVRIRAVQALHGRTALGIVARRGRWYLLFLAAAGAAGWLLWTLIGAVFWRSAPLTGFPQSIFAVVLSVTIVIAMIVTVLGMVVVDMVVARIVDQIKGRKPLKTLMVSSSVVMLVSLVCVFQALGAAMNNIASMASMSEGADNAMMMSKGYLLRLTADVDGRSDSLAGFDAFRNEAQRKGLLRIVNYEPDCGWIASNNDPKGPSQKPCAVLDSDTARGLRLVSERSSDGVEHVTILLPPSLMAQSESVRESALEQLEAECDFGRQYHETLALPAEDSVVIRELKYDGELHFSNVDAVLDHRTSVKGIPVVIVPPKMLSSASMLSLASSQGAYFLYSSKQSLFKDLKRFGASAMFDSAVKPEDELRTRSAEAAELMMEFTIFAVLTLLDALATGVILAMVYCALRRQMLFVQHIHGATFMQRYGPYFLLEAGIVAVAFVPTIPGSSMMQLLACALAVALIVVSSGIALIIHDRSLRADTIKHP